MIMARPPPRFGHPLNIASHCHTAFETAALLFSVIYIATNLVIDIRYA